MFDRTGDTFEEGATVANTSEPIANTSTSSEETIELWLSDLIHNIPALRETDNYNKLRSAVDDLKSKLQHG